MAVMTAFDWRKGNPTYWFPKSQIKFDKAEYAEALETKGPCNFLIPQWLIDEKKIDPDTECDTTPAPQAVPQDGPPQKKFDGPPYALLNQICESTADFLLSMDGLDVSDATERKASALVGLLRKGKFFKKKEA